MSRRTLVTILLLALCCSGPAPAQRSPSVQDVYASRPSTVRLGPRTGPRELLERARSRRDDAARALRYEVALARKPTAASTVAPHLVLLATVELGAGLTRGDERPFRIELADGSATVVRDDAGYALLDRDGAVVSRGRAVAAAGPLAEWLPYLLLEGLEPDDEPRSVDAPGDAADDDSESESHAVPRVHRVHVVARERRAHVYAEFVPDEPLPRRLEWIVDDGAGPTTVVATISDVGDARSDPR